MVNLNIMDNKSYNELDKVYLQIKEFLNKYTKSTILRIPEYPDGNSEGIRTLNR